MAHLKREAVVFTILFLFLSIAMHFGAWIDHPLAQFEGLKSSSLGIWHPLLITLLVYMVFLLLRLLMQLIKKLVD